jgi:hypothetical protein
MKLERAYFSSILSQRQICCIYTILLFLFPNLKPKGGFSLKHLECSIEEIQWKKIDSSNTDEKS